MAKLTLEDMAWDIKNDWMHECIRAAHTSIVQLHGVEAYDISEPPAEMKDYSSGMVVVGFANPEKTLLQGCVFHTYGDCGTSYSMWYGWHTFDIKEAIQIDLNEVI